jgi:hypothetical protein
MPYRTPALPDSSRWKLIVEGLLYEHLNVPETWVARRGGEVALLVGGRRAFGGHQEIAEELRRPEHLRAPLVGTRVFRDEVVEEPSGSLRTWRCGVCPWPAVTGLTLEGMSHHLPSSRLPPGAAVEVAAQLAAARQLAPGTHLTCGRVIVFESGEVRVMPALPALQASAEPSFMGTEYLDYLGSDRASPGASAAIASALLDLLTGFGRQATAKPRTLRELLEQPPPPRHRLPSDLGVRLPAAFRQPDILDTIVAHGLQENSDSPACYLESLQALSRALDGRTSLARAVVDCAAQAALAPPSTPYPDGTRRESFLPCH